MSPAVLRRRDGRLFILPVESASEAVLVHDPVVYPEKSRHEVCTNISGRMHLEKQASQPTPVNTLYPDLANLRRS